VSTPVPISGNPLRAILEVSAALVSSTEYHEVLANVVQKIGEAMSVWSVGMSSYVPERDIVIFEAWWCEGGISQEDIDYIGTVANLRERSDLRHIIETPGVQVESITDADLPELDREEMTKWGVKTSVDTALHVGDEVIGILGVEEKRFARTFTDIETDLFGKLCDLAAIGTYNARLFRRQRERSRHLASLIESSRALSGGLKPEELFATIAAASARALDAPRAIVAEYDAAAETLTPRATFQSEPVEGYDTTGSAEAVEQALGDRSILTAGTPVVQYISDDDLTAAYRELMDRWDEKTVLNVPIAFRRAPLGVLTLAWTDRERVLTPDDLALASGVAGQAAVALRKARLRALPHHDGRPDGGQA
jgi:GAF domain-containing protein